MSEENVLDVTLDDLEDAPESQPTAPNGEYRVRIADFEAPQATKEGNGKYVRFRTQIIEGPYAGLNVYGMWTLRNAEGKQDNTWRSKADLRRLGFEGSVAGLRLSDLIGLECIAKVREQDRKDFSTGKADPSRGKENSLGSFVRRA